MRLILFVGVIACMTGCSTVKTLEKALDDAARLATGPCGTAVASAMAICKEQSQIPAP